MIRDAAAHVATTHEEADDFTAYGVRADRVHVIPNAIEFPQHTPGGSSGYPAPLSLFVGRLASEKGPDLLLDAFCRIAGHIPHHLVLAGLDTGMLHSLRSTAAREGLAARVHFPGAIPHDQMERAMAASEVVVVPSRADAMTLVILDAAVHARPLIITDRCGVSSFAEAGVVRLTSADPASIAEALLDVLTSADRGAAMGRALREYVIAHYTWDTVVESYRGLFRSVVWLFAERSLDT
jgi:glycosyltransferase involved in cell wall biosynthesis